MVNKLDDLYARAWEREYERPTFDNNHDIAVKTISPNIVIESDRADNEKSTIPGTIQNYSTQLFPQTEGLTDRINTDHYMEPDAERSVEQPTPTPTNPCSTKHDLSHNPKPI